MEANANTNTAAATTPVIGKPLDRRDAPLKVTGAAVYAAEFKVNNPAYAVLLESEIAKGRVRSIDRSAAEKMPGVLAVITHQNMPRLTKPNPAALAALVTAPGENRIPCEDNIVHHAGQHIGLVVAETYEQAREAARRVRVVYDREKPEVEIEPNLARAEKPEKFFGFEEVQVKRGDARAALSAVAVKIEQTYETPVENHHPMEPHASIAVWEGNRLTVYDATQAVIGSQKYLAAVFGLPDENVRVVAQYIGGGFGCKGLVWGHPILAAVAARQLKRPVKLVLMRQQMQTSVGHRGRTVQRVALGANRDGQMQSIRHEIDTSASFIGDFFEPPGIVTKLLYAAPNLEVAHNVVRLNTGTPTPMRAPGESPGTFALESALDELAHELKIDPIELRVKNHADINPETKKPWSSKFLKECYQTGAEKFGWSRRKREPRAVRDGRWLIGYGMATATYPGYRSPASARVRIVNDGTAIVSSATQDIGTGTYTVLMQVAAEFLGLPVERIRVDIGDSRLPVAPTSGGSQTVASVAPAVKQACEMAQAEIVKIAVADNRSPLAGRKAEEIAFGDGGRMFVKNDQSKGETYADVLRRANRQMVEGCVTAMTAMAQQQSEQPRNPAVKESQESSGQASAGAPPCTPGRGEAANADQQKFSFHSFGAQFAEVGVDEDLGIVRVRRFVSVQDIGRVMNQKTARSQVYSGVIYGIGMALMEETHYDRRNGRPVVRTLADYHVPVHLDVPPVEVYVIGKPDPHINALGARGIGEIGITGVAAAIANAVFNATGKRVRSLPITPDKLL